MKVVGLTGGIGTGKTSVSMVFQTLGIPVFFADEAGRSVLDEEPKVREAVTELLGNHAYSNGSPDRAYIASVVFSDPAKLSRLNDIIHPAVARRFWSWHEKHKHEAVYCLREAAILFESGANKDCEQVICVSAPEPLRIERVRHRDGISEAGVRERMQRQMPQPEKETLSDHVIMNDGLQAVIPQVMIIHKRIMAGFMGKS